jgi:hypothetical protein
VLLVLVLVLVWVQALEGWVLARVQVGRISARAGELGRSWDSYLESDLRRRLLIPRVQVPRLSLSPRHLRIRDPAGVSGWYLRLLFDKVKFEPVSE